MTTPITRQELWSRLERGPSIALVEALAPDFYEPAHHPGAVNITPRTPDPAAEQLLPDRSQTVVVYASAGHAAAGEVAVTLMALGYADVRLYVEGKEAWAEAGLPLEGAATNGESV